MSKELEALENLLKQEIIVKKGIGIYMDGSVQTMLHKTTVGVEFKGDIETLQQALQRLDKYEQILGSGRLTDRNYKNTTLDLDSCKPYLRLGQLEDIYEDGK